MKYLAVVIGLIGSVWVTTTTCSARQSDTARAALAVEVNFDRLGVFGVEQLPESIRSGPLSGPELQWLKQASRLTVYLSPPASLANLAEMDGPGAVIPFELLARIEFKNSSGQKEFMDRLKGEMVEVSEGGEKLFKPNEHGPANLRLRLVGDATIEMGTQSFLSSAAKPLLTPRLEEIWKNTPNHAVRLAFDLESASELVQGAIEEASPGAPRGVRPFLDLIPKISTVRLTVDGKDATLLSLLIDGKDEAAADELFEGLEGLLGMAKVAAIEANKQLHEQSPKMAVVGGEIVESLNSKKAGRTITLSIPRPDGFDDAVQEAISAAPK